MATLCETFKQLALDTWDKIQESRIVNFQLKEETFTDINMLDLKLKHSGQIKTKVFTKREEGKNGADWEWWFQGRSGNWIGFRVQAKIINLLSNEFEHLHYQNPRTHIYQCDKLIQNALSHSTPKIPLYCFFIQTENQDYLNKWTCGTFPKDKKLYGCSLTSAFEVLKLRPTDSKHIIDLENSLKPWHCLVCCKGFGRSTDFITNIQAYAKENFVLDKDLAQNLNVEIPESFTTNEPPSYVLSILKYENNESIDAPDSEIDGVIIVTEKQ